MDLDMSIALSEPVKTDEKPGRDFWCVVAYMDYTGNPDHGLPAYTNCCAIMLQSDDCSAVDLLPELDFGECGGDMSWAKDKPSGLYHLTLASRAYASNSYEGVIDSVEIWPVKVSCLCNTGLPLTPIDLKTGFCIEPVTGG